MQDKSISESLGSFQILMKFIQKSTLVNQASLLAGSSIKEGAFVLKKALDDGDSLHAIFDDPNCQLYLIYLLREHLISEEKFLTGYLYISVLMQFSEKQLIHPEHADARRLDWGKTHVFNSKDSSLLRNYAEHIEAAFDHHISAREIVNYFNSVSGSECWIIGMPYKPHVKNDDVSGMMRTNIQFSPLLQIHSDSSQKYVLIPSIAFSKWLLKKLNPERQIEITPCFGNVGIMSLYEHFHSQNKHPVTIHSAYIKSNPKRIHQSQAGPVPFALHDIFFHCFGASAFKKNEYDFLMQFMIPALQKIVDSESNEVRAMAISMRDIINDLAFNPTNLINKNSLVEYITNKLASDKYGTNDFGQLNEDELVTYFILLQKLCQELYQHKDRSPVDVPGLLEKAINMNFIHDVEFDAEGSREEALKTVASMIYDLQISSLSIKEMRNQLNGSLVSRPEIGLLINKAGFPFLPPLHSFPEDLLHEALHLLKKDIENPHPLLGKNQWGLFSEEKSSIHPGGHFSFTEALRTDATDVKGNKNPS